MLQLIPIVFYGALFGVVYLIMLNGFLNGSMKTRIDAILSVLLIFLIGFGFCLFEWILAFANILGCFVWGAAIRSIAKRSAIFLVSHPPGR